MMISSHTLRCAGSEPGLPLLVDTYSEFWDVFPFPSRCTSRALKPTANRFRSRAARLDT